MIHDIETAQDYRCFARTQAHGRSPAYESLAYAVAEDKAVLSLLADLPAAKRQPNLLFASARYLLGAPPEPGSLHELVVSKGEDLRGVILSRRTQTNEPARCAVLLPALASVPEPLAIIEVGAAAGLTLLPNLYSYDYAGYRVVGPDPVAMTS